MKTPRILDVLSLNSWEVITSVNARVLSRLFDNMHLSNLPKDVFPSSLTLEVNVLFSGQVLLLHTNSHIQFIKVSSHLAKKLFSM